MRTKLKYLMAVLMLVAFTFSCDLSGLEDDCEPSCGVVRSKHHNVHNGLYILDVYNDCSGNKWQFSVSKQEYEAFSIGEMVCAVDGRSW